MPPGGDFGVFSRCSLAPKVFELCRGFLVLLPPCFAAVFSAAMPPPPPPEEPESFRRRRIWTGLSFFYHARGRSRVEFYEYRGFWARISVLLADLLQCCWQFCNFSALFFQSSVLSVLVLFPLGLLLGLDFVLKQCWRKCAPFAWTFLGA
jgi:hypothetical protein